MQQQDGDNMPAFKVILSQFALLLMTLQTDFVNSLDSVFLLAMVALAKLPLLSVI